MAAPPEGESTPPSWRSVDCRARRRARLRFLFSATTDTHALSPFHQGSRVLVCEACNHDRITAACNDIGLAQIPAALVKVGGKSHLSSPADLVLDHAWGRALPDVASGEEGGADTAYYDLAVHCGGCMLDTQQMKSRLRALAAAGTPVVNYGLLLAAAKGGVEAVRRAVAPLVEEGSEERR